MTACWESDACHVILIYLPTAGQSWKSGSGVHQKSGRVHRLAVGFMEFTVGFIESR